MPIVFNEWQHTKLRYPTIIFVQIQLGRSIGVWLSNCYFTANSLSHAHHINSSLANGQIVILRHTISTKNAFNYYPICILINFSSINCVSRTIWSENHLFRYLHSICIIRYNIKVYVSSHTIWSKNHFHLIRFGKRTGEKKPNRNQLI